MIVNKFDDILLVWKPSMVASTQGNKENVVDLIDQEDDVFFDMIDKDEIYEHFSIFQGAFSALLKSNFSFYYNSYQHIVGKDFIKQQKETFSVDEEYGLLNRLDLATQGWMYFAGNKPVYKHRSDRQNDKRIVKTYYAVVYGAVENYFEFGVKGKIGLSLGDSELIIDRPIMHHKDDATKMLAIIDENQQKKGRGKPQHAISTITPCSYDEERDTSLIKVTMHVGIRHQIRVHCASIGHPIVGDDHYGNDGNSSSIYGDTVGLCLWSMGVDWNE